VELIGGCNLYSYEIKYWYETKKMPLQTGTSIRIHTSNYLEWLTNTIETLKADNERLREYVQHLPHCFKIRNIIPETDTCTCGLEQALQGGE